MTWLRIAPEQLIAGEVVLHDTHYLGRVLRARAGDEVTVFDGEGKFAAATVARFDKRSITLSVDEPMLQPRPSGTLIARLALIKGERLDFAVQKLTELGVDTIELIDTKHAVVKWPENRAESKRRRLGEIATAAAAQSHRAYIPEVRGPLAVADDAGQCDVRVALTTADCASPLAEILAGLGRTPTVSFAVGPEGGFADDERDSMLAAGHQMATLGPAILRAETAAITAAALCSFAMGRLG